MTNGRDPADAPGTPTPGAHPDTFDQDGAGHETPGAPASDSNASDEAAESEQAGRDLGSFLTPGHEQLWQTMAAVQAGLHVRRQEAAEDLAEAQDQLQQAGAEAEDAYGREDWSAYAKARAREAAARAIVDELHRQLGEDPERYGVAREQTRVVDDA